MLSFTKDGKTVGCENVYDKARPEQIIVLTAVSYGDSPDLAKCPFAAYQQPSLFTVVKKIRDPQGFGDCFTVRDADGKEFDALLGVGVYDAQQWIEWTKAKHAEDLRQKNARIQHVESQVALLRGILIDQGVRVITPDQAKQLNLQKT